MGALLPTNKYIHVLLLGGQNVGKTKFLYEGLLQNNFKDKIKTTEGYNMECMRFDQTAYALWDLSASPEFINLWHVFYQFIPFELTIFVVRIDKIKKKQHYEWMAQGRQLLNRLFSLDVFKLKPLILLVNADIENYSQQTDKQEALSEVKYCLGFDEIEAKEKQALILDFNAFLEHEQVLQLMDKMYKKVQEEREKKDQK